MYRPEFNTTRLDIIEKLNVIINSKEARCKLMDSEYRAIMTARNFIKAYYDNAEHERGKQNEHI